jgi:hypothetical protein
MARYAHRYEQFWNARLDRLEDYFRTKDKNA